MDLSYAQHLEDYHLSVAFEGQKTGFYIDVGAGHPVADNVSCWFYLAGWNGIVVEPQADLAAKYAHVRPRDIAVAALVGAQEGEAEFHHVERLHGFSTILPDVARQARDMGARVETRRLPMTTLAALGRQHGWPRVDFLKIDVEGAEGDVLAGNDWSRLRPRVILLEAVAPGSMAEAHAAWEPLLLSQNYDFVLFEGLNRFYVAREDEALLARFPRQMADWNVVPHLGHTNRAPFRDDHPDHAFAKDLVGGFMAGLPGLDRDLVVDMLTSQIPDRDLDAPPDAAARQAAVDRLFPGGRFAQARCGLAGLDAPTLRAFYRTLVDSDAFRVMTGRLAMSWDGGQILD
ncbi:MAG: FkbM family methyltransferase [Beijerinckiaceae bacterium]|nr:FkbM family methyltransferase [Beijerinckiaceae bacterium]